MEWTPFAGLTALDENDAIAIDGGSFLIKNPRITDHLLQVGAVTHRHDAHAAHPSPHVAMTGSPSPTAGQLAPGETYALTYTIVDSYGGETTAATPLVLTTTGGIPTPTVAPTAVVDTTAGIMQAGGFYYALTYTDGAGGETPIGPSIFVYVDPGAANSQVLLSGLTAEFVATGAVTWRLWRSYEGANWHLVSEGNTATFDDAGFDPPDNPALPPEQNTTAQQGSLSVTLPTATAEPALATGVSINIYLAPDTNFISPCLYETLPISDAGSTFSITSDAVLEGSPPHVSTCTPGAAKINPDTDINNWYWKSPVANQAALPSTGNNDGDVRVTLNNQLLWVWRAATSAWVQWNPVGAVLTSSQQAASYTLALADAGTVVEFTGSSAETCTIPAHSTVAFPVGTVIEIFQYGTGQVTVAAATGVTLRSDGGLVHTTAQYATISLRQRAIDEWVLSGDLA